MQTFLADLHEKIDQFLDYALFFIVLVLALLLAVSLIRFLFGKKNQLGKALTSAMEILCLYLLCLTAYALGLHWDYFSAPLPFISMTDGTVYILSIRDAGFSAISPHLAKLLLLAFGVNLLNAFIPSGKRFGLWLLLRMASMVLVIFVNYGLNLLLNVCFPQGIAAVAPIILLAALAVLILLGSLKLLVGLALFVSNPVIGALYTFFFSNLIGRSLARAILSAGAVTALVYLMNALGIFTLSFTAVGLIWLLPVLLIIIRLWYLIDRII